MNGWSYLANLRTARWAYGQLATPNTSWNKNLSNTINMWNSSSTPVKCVDKCLVSCCKLQRWRESAPTFHIKSFRDSEDKQKLFLNPSMFIVQLLMVCMSFGHHFQFQKAPSQSGWCQIKVQFESGAKIKFLAALFYPMTSISDYQSVPWCHRFQNMYNTHMCKMHLKVEK